VLQKQLRENMKSAKGDREKQLVAKVVSREIIAKYKTIGKLGGFCSWKRFNSAKKMNCFTYRKKKRSDNITDASKYEVRKFFERDTSSRMCAGRKDCITRGSVKKQKRLLVDTTGNLYNRFQREHTEKVSYAAFWVVLPRLQDSVNRDVEFPELGVLAWSRRRVALRKADSGHCKVATAV